jgi:hypothetical protein
MSDDTQTSKAETDTGLFAGESLGQRADRLKAAAASRATAAAEARQKFGTTAGKGLGAAEKNTGSEPKQEPGESPAAYGARLRKWRSDNDIETQARNKALGGS